MVSPTRIVWAAALAVLSSGCASVAASEAAPAAPGAQVFILAGQSNMSGRGRLDEAPAWLRQGHPHVWLYANDGRLRPAREPLDDAAGQVDVVSRDDAAGVGPGLSFGTSLALADPSAQVILVPCAKGGSRMAAWARDASRESLYGSCVARVREAAHGRRLAGLIWYQGESDGRDLAEARAWGGRFRALVAGFRADLDEPHLPVLFVRLPAPPDSAEFPRQSFPGWAEVRRQQARVAIPRAASVPTDGLPLNPDGLHLATAGQVELGARLARAWRAAFAGAR